MSQADTFDEVDSEVDGAAKAEVLAWLSGHAAYVWHHAERLRGRGQRFIGRIVRSRRVLLRRPR